MSRDGSSLQHLFRSPWTVWMGLRYLRSKKSSRFLSFITILSTAGVTLGVTAIIVVLSVMDGFETALTGRLLSSELHILIEPGHTVPGFSGGFVPIAEFEETAGSKELVADPRVVGVSAVASAEAILRSGRSVAGVMLKGVDDARFARLKPRIVEALDEGALKEDTRRAIESMQGLVVGKELAYNLGLIPGDFVTLVSPTETQGPLGAVPRMKRFYVKGIYESSQVEEEIHTVFAQAPAVYSFLRLRDVASQWEITVQKSDDAPELANRLRTLLPGYRVKDWVQLNSNLFASLRLERIAMFLILVFIIVVASFNIVTTLSLMVIEKKKEIAILKAMGARHGQVGAVFLAEGALIGLSGAGLGVVLAGIICFIIGKTDMVTLPDVYYDRTLPVSFVPAYYVGVALCALMIVLAACLYPTRRAVRLHPLEGIRS